MTILFLILILISAIILGFIILVQNPKGGGLSANVGGLSNQFMGVKQTTDVLEKGTWIFAGVVALLCLFSALFIPSTKQGNGLIDQINTKPAATAPAAAPAATPVSPNAAPAAAPATAPATTPAPAK